MDVTTIMDDVHVALLERTVVVMSFREKLAALGNVSTRVKHALLADLNGNVAAASTVGWLDCMLGRMVSCYRGSVLGQWGDNLPRRSRACLTTNSCTDCHEGHHPKDALIRARDKYPAIAGDIRTGRWWTHMEFEAVSRTTQRCALGARFHRRILASHLLTRACLSTSTSSW